MNIEVFDRAFNGSLVGFDGIKIWSAIGFTSIYMGLLAGCLSLLIAFLCDNPKYFNLKAYQKILIGGLVITLGELISGVILNLWLHLNIWSYAGDRFNFLGQIELKNCILWTFIIAPLVIWLDSHLTYYLYKEDKPISLIGFYKDLFTMS
jgi:uncharacterized membrane protein